MKRLLLITLCTLTTMALADGPKKIRIPELFHRSPAELNRVLGKHAGEGRGVTFREYKLPDAGLFAKFTKGKATTIAVTFFKPYPSPEKAVAAVGINLGAKKPSSQNIIERQWTNVGGGKRLTVSSSDGKLWETVELSD